MLEDGEEVGGVAGGHRHLDPFNPYVRSCLYSLVGGLDGELVVVDERVSGVQLDLDWWMELGQLLVEGGGG